MPSFSPRFTIPFPTPRLEALAAGLPVITTQANGFLRDHAARRRDGEVLPAPSEGIPEALQKWRELETPALRARAPALGRAAYTMERNVRETLARDPLRSA